MDSFISWIGGKKLLRRAILEQFPETGTFDRYIEVFGGAAWLLFSKESHATMEVYNDINGELVNLFRIVKYHPDALQKELDGTLMSREMFLDAIQPARGLTDIQRAARFWIAIKESFGTNLHSFICKGYNIQNAVELIKVASVRLNKVIIENNDFGKLIKTYDMEKALFYLDPPYYDAEKYYPDRFQPEDHIRLKESLEHIKGRFILSYNDCPEIRKLYDRFVIIEVERQDNLVSKNGSRKYKELIIKNY